MSNKGIEIGHIGIKTSGETAEDIEKRATEDLLDNENISETEFDDLVFAEVVNARHVYDRLCDQALPKNEVNAMIRAMYDGNKPYDGELEAFRHNFNNRLFEKKINELRLNYRTLLTHSANFIDVTYDDPEQEARPADAGDIECALEAAFTTLMKKDRTFLKELLPCLEDAIIYGHGLGMWEEENDYKIKYLNATQTLFPYSTSVCPSDWSYFFVEHEYTFNELYNFYQSGSSKWNRGALEFLLAANLPDGADDEIDETANFQDRIQDRVRANAEGCVDLVTSSINVVSIFWRRFDGKVAHGIFSPGYGNSKGSGERYLFLDLEKYKSFETGFFNFYISHEQLYIDQLKGWGHRIANVAQSANRFFLTMLDSGTLNSTAIVKKQSEFGDNNLEDAVVDLGGMMLFNGGVETDRFQMDAQSPLAIYQVLKNELNEITYSRGLNGLEKFGDGRGFELVKLVLSLEARVHKYYMDDFTKLLSDFYRETFRKVLIKHNSDSRDPLLRKYFSLYLRRRAIDSEILMLDDHAKANNDLPLHLDVDAARPGGAGTQVADELAVAEGKELFSLMGEQGQEWFRNLWAKSLFGPEGASKAFPDEDFANIISFQRQMAILENEVLTVMISDFEINGVADNLDKQLNDLDKFKEYPASADNDHFVHAQEHTAEMEEQIRLYQEGVVDITTAHVRLRSLAQHNAQHLQALQSSPLLEQESAQIKQAFDGMINDLRAIESNANKKREAVVKQRQQIAQEQDKINDPKTIQALADSRIKQARVEQLTNIESILKVQTARAKAQTDRQVALINAQAEADAKRIKAQGAARANNQS